MDKHDKTKCPNCENCIRDLRADNTRLRAELEQAHRELAQKSEDVHCLRGGVEYEQEKRATAEAKLARYEAAFDDFYNAFIKIADKYALCRPTIWLTKQHSEVVGESLSRTSALAAIEGNTSNPTTK